MIAQIVFDLPLDGPFDYLIPEHLVPKITVGSRVKVSFGPRPQIGFVIGIIAQSSISKLKPIQSLCDTSAIFNSLDLTFAQDFCAYYGCSLGEALSTMLRNKEGAGLSVHRDHKPVLTLYRCQPNHYVVKIQEIMRNYHRHSERSEESQFLILVPDTFRAETISQQLKGHKSAKIGTRSSVFESDGRYDCVIMVDEEDSSYKQEQMPMYETHQVLLERSKMYGFDISFVGISPSVELMSLVRDNQVKMIEGPMAGLPVARLVDLSNYKFVPGLLSPPVRDALDAALKAGKKSILVLNYKGIGVDHLKTELKRTFPQAKIATFERAARVVARSEATKQSLISNFDILITTQAILRFQGKWQVAVAAFINFDAGINRLDMRSAFNAFSLGLHISSMAIESVFIQTRNSNHYVLQSLSSGKTQDFYDEELKLRKEFGCSPFKHWIKMTWRGKSEKSTHQAALQWIIH